MDSQSTVDHLRDEANARNNTTLGNLLDTAAEELDEAKETIDRLTVLANNNAAAHAKVCESLAAARDEISGLRRRI